MGLRVTQANGENPGLKCAVLRQIYTWANWAITLGLNLILWIDSSLENVIAVTVGAVFLEKALGEAFEIRANRLAGRVGIDGPGCRAEYGKDRPGERG